MAPPGDNVPSTAVYLEVGSKRVFSCALEWPGWCRSGKDEQGALAALEAAAARYAIVAAEAQVPFPSGAVSTFDVVERLRGSATTDFGAPGEVATRDREPLTTEQAARQAALVAASWAVFDRVVAGAPAELRKGPRGGGRDRDAIVEHVLGAETSYVRKLDLRLRRPDPGDAAALGAHREAILAALTARAGAVPPKGWPVPYLARRIAWHALDHAWEIEDRV